jgi:hypothetical protein
MNKRRWPWRERPRRPDRHRPPALDQRAPAVAPGIGSALVAQRKTSIAIKPVSAEQIDVFFLFAIVIADIGTHVPNQQTGSRLAAIVVLGLAVAILK